MTTQTSDAGAFSFAGLAAGSYTVTLDAAGFKRTQVLCALTEAKDLALEIALEVAGISETVEIVSGESTLLSNLPLNGRSPLGLMRLRPGAKGGAPARNAWRGESWPNTNATAATTTPAAPPSECSGIRVARHGPAAA